MHALSGRTLGGQPITARVNYRSVRPEIRRTPILIKLWRYDSTCFAKIYLEKIFMEQFSTTGTRVGNRLFPVGA